MSEATNTSTDASGTGAEAPPAAAGSPPEGSGKPPPSGDASGGNAEAARYRTERNAAQLELAIHREAHSRGLDPEATARLIDRADVRRENGAYTGLGAAIDAAVKRFPGVVRAAKPATGGSPAAPAQTGTEPLTRDDLKGKSAAWINANWDRVKAVVETRR